MIIKQLETKYGIKGKTAIHRQAWKEAYVGLANRDLSEKCDMEFLDYPNDKTGLFESSEKNYYWCTGNTYTYLCSKEESDQVDPWNDLREYGWVISRYLRYDVIEHGEVIFSNPETVNDDKAGRFVIIRDEPFEYTIQSWGERKLISHEVRKDEGFNEALQPVYFASHKKALRNAVKLSMKDDCQYIVCRQLGSYDRH